MTHAENIDVFEHGIEAIGEPPKGLLRLATRDPGLIYSGYTLAVVDRDGSSLNHRAAHLVKVPAHTVSDFYEEHDVRYCLKGTLYHLNQIVDLYVDKCRLFEDIHPVGPLTGNTGDERIFYEVDAFLGAARRVYEAISKVLWKHYAASRGMKGRWSSMRKAVAAAEKSDIIPAEFFQPLEQSWKTRGLKLAAYRNYVMHTSSLIAANSTCWMTRFEGRWGATVPLPANPETKRRGAIDSRDGVDSVEYCYGVATPLVGLSESLMALPEISSFITNPPRHHGCR
jgi:hypothetical protein